jgi:hypothetical protein
VGGGEVLGEVGWAGSGEKRVRDEANAPGIICERERGCPSNEAGSGEVPRFV